MSAYRALLLAALLLLPVEAAAQRRTALIEEPGGTMVGVALVFDAGLPWEPPSRAGITALAARAVVEELAPALDSLAATAAVVCEDVATTTLLLAAPPDTWEAATLRLIEALGTGRAGVGAIERARAALMRRLAFRAESPAAEAQAALHRAIYGPDHRWAGAPCGRRETIVALQPEEIQNVAARFLRLQRATAAVAGPVDRGAMERVFGPTPGATRLPFLVPGPLPEPAFDSVRVEAATVTSWVGVAFPFGRGADVEALRLLAHDLERELRPGPTRPSVHAVSTTVSRHGAGGQLVIWMVTDPGAAEPWVERIGARVAATAAERLDERPFESLLRTYRGARLLALSAPEERAREAAGQLFFGGGFTPPAAAIDALTPERLQRAAAALGAPAVLVYGPVQ